MFDGGWEAKQARKEEGGARWGCIVHCVIVYCVLCIE